MSEYTLSLAAQTALSYLEDVERKNDLLDQQDNSFARENDGLRLINGDLQLAMSQVSEAHPDEQDDLYGLCYYQKSSILFSIACGHSKYDQLGGEHHQKTLRFLADSGEACAKAINYNPKPGFYLQLGSIYNLLNRKAEAVKMFEMAANGDDPKIAIAARKEIGRIGPVASEALPLSDSDGNVVFVRKQKPQWGMIIKGSVFFVVGLLLAGFIIGIPIIFWGLYLILRGFISQVDA